MQSFSSALSHHFPTPFPNSLNIHNSAVFVFHLMINEMFLICRCKHEALIRIASVAL